MADGQPIVGARPGLLAAFALQLASAQGACPPTAQDGSRVEGTAVQAAWRAEPAPIVQGQPFALIVKLCPPQAQLLGVDATMPEHRHGMNYRTSLQPLGESRWRVEGLLWHMAGRWELRLDVLDVNGHQSLRQSVMLR